MIIGRRIFANCDIDIKIVISKDQLKCIININETCLDRDGIKIYRGGRPSVIFYHGKLPKLGKAKIKNITAITMIEVIIASGEPFPPHFQLLTKAKYEDTMRMRKETVAYFHKLLGPFIWNKEKNDLSL